MCSLFCMADPNDTVEVVTADKTFSGRLMPNEETDALVLKLENGYNIGIAQEKVKEVKVVSAFKEKEERHEKIVAKKGLPTIAILHTGGTIASKVDYATGGVVAKFSAEDMLNMVPELKEIANIKTDLIANMMSEDMLIEDYKKLSRAVQKHAKKVDGIIIGHGTDTLAYSAAALSFIFEKINIPVLIVGSQRSPDRGSTDAVMNLICAAEFIAKSDFVGVGICMHHSTNDDECAILPGTKTRKMHTSRRDAFKAINDTPIALVNYKTKEIRFLKDTYSKKTKDDEIIAKDDFEKDTGLLKVHPVMKNRLFELFSESYKGFVLEGTGLGHAPTNLGDENLKNHATLKKYIAEGGIVAVTSQCLFGSVHPYVYVNLRRLSSIGCVYCKDMLPETALIKLSWLLGNYKDVEQIKRLLVTNLRGEINEREVLDDYGLSGGDR